MIRRVRLIGKCVVGAVVLGALGLASASAQTPATTKPTPSGSDAFAAADPVPYLSESDWWSHGTIEAGGRFFLNNPPRNGSVYKGQDSLAKYYEYSTIKPGAFANFAISTGTKNGLYQIDIGGKNVGYDDQYYYLDASKAGQQYFNFTWDQTPHLYSTSAQTFYQGVGTTSLTLPPGFPNPNTNPGAVVPFLYTTDLGIKRDTASADYRWTPTDAWDVKADYSYMHRSGTQIDGVIGFGPSFGYGPTQVPRPVDDVTQNYGVNGEYAGTSPWGKRFTFKLAYNGSTYTDDFTSYTIADPLTNGQAYPIARLSTWPSNNANAIGATFAADLPWNSRYVGTVNYNMMRQNSAFIPMSANANPAFPLPASSLDGQINTLLSNNVLTTKITPELTSKLSYRYYNFDNQTPQIFFPCTGASGVNCTTAWISFDRTSFPGGNEKQAQSLSQSYVKQDAGADLNWRPSREWNLGVAYGYERYDYTQFAASSTDQNSGKIYADWTPSSWLTLRASSYYSDRTANNINYLNNQGYIQWPNTTPAGNSFFYQPAYRQLYLDDRRQWKVKAAMDLVVVHGLTLTPSVTYQDNYYPGVNGTTTLGMNDSKSWSAGIDATYLVNAGTSVSVGYMYESYAQFLYGSSVTSATAVIGKGGVYSVQTNDKTTVNTFTAGVRYEAIPEKLNLSLRYAASRGVDNMVLNRANGLQPNGGQFPEYTTWFQRLDAEAAYRFDKEQLARLGWKGEVVAKLHYVWESNSVASWQNDPLAPYNVPPLANGTAAIFMAYDNPNYNIQMLMASLAFTW
jgi:MtrB/PioB family decaheme-associated outer membrane protein